MCCALLCLWKDEKRNGMVSFFYCIQGSNLKRAVRFSCHRNHANFILYSIILRKLAEVAQSGCITSQHFWFAIIKVRNTRRRTNIRRGKLAFWHSSCISCVFVWTLYKTFPNRDKSSIYKGIRDFDKDQVPISPRHIPFTFAEKLGSLLFT